MWPGPCIPCPWKKGRHAKTGAWAAAGNWKSQGRGAPGWQTPAFRLLVSRTDREYVSGVVSCSVWDSAVCDSKEQPGNGYNVHLSGNTHSKKEAPCPKTGERHGAQGSPRLARGRSTSPRRPVGLSVKTLSLGKMLPGADGTMWPQDQPLPELSCPFCPGISKNIPQS